MHDKRELFVSVLALGSPIVIGVGAESDGQVCDRTATAMASLLSTVPTIFPGDHTGFVEHPESFAATFRNIISNGEIR